MSPMPTTIMGVTGCLYAIAPMAAIAAVPTPDQMAYATPMGMVRSAWDSA